MSKLRTTTIVNVATPDGWYHLGQRRLAKSLDDVGYTGYREFFRSEQECGAPRHERDNYVFKACAMNRAPHEGIILWCDASVWAVKDLTPIWQAIEEDGYFFCQHGDSKIGTWTNDKTLDSFWKWSCANWRRDQAVQRQMLSSGVWGVDMSRTIGQKLREAFYDYRHLFHGAWTNDTGSESSDPRCKGHRHDQSVLSILAWEYGCKIRFGQETVAYVSPGQPVPETAIFLARGMRGDETEQDWMKV